ncbi:MAG: hypothetical protein DHS20C18_14160 [Saprospiraceae bacterium]|nr:MAG: hypothetical protein DHS20C18_14160 [Saprospiraceae bacterium]
METSASPATHNAQLQLKKNFQQQAGFAQQQQMLLLEQIEKIKIRQESWLSRLSITSGEQRLLTTFWESQDAALKQALANRNNNLTVIGEAQAAFIREVSNSLLATAKAHLQFDKANVYQKQLLQLQIELEKLNRHFLDLLTDKMLDAENRPDYFRKMLLSQIEKMMNHWDEQYNTILEDFSKILVEKV